jgi:hypothetical protein
LTIANNDPKFFDYIGVFSICGRIGDPEFEAQLDEIQRDMTKLRWTGTGDIDTARSRIVAERLEYNRPFS